MTIHRNIGIAPTVEELATEFLGWSDGWQTKFFQRVAAGANNWENPQLQWRYIGHNLRDEGTPEARDMLRDIVAFMDNKPRGIN